METEIEISRNRGSVYVDLESDIDHLARYTIVLWQEDSQGKWQQLPDGAQPRSSNTSDPAHHLITFPPGLLAGKALQVFVAINSVVPTPGKLNLALHVWQGPRDLKLGARKSGAGGVYVIDYHKPVPPGEELTFDVAWRFKVV